MTRFVTREKPVASQVKTRAMDHKFKEAFPYLEFATDANFQNIVIPTGGTVTIEASENGKNWGSIPDGTDIDVTTEDYTRPVAGGSIQSMRATPTGITGAAYWRMIVARY